MNSAIRPVNGPEELPAVRELFREYAEALGVDLETQNFSGELAALPGKYAPPSGCLLLASVNGEAAGCVALRFLAPGVCEMKRLYVRPAYRRLGLGRLLVERLVQEARVLGYDRMCLDTIPQRMEPAAALYRALGFVAIPPYWENVLPGVEYMERRL